MKLYTAKAVAGWLDMTERNVRQLKDKNIIKETRPGLYKLQDCIHAYINYLRGKAPEKENLDYNEERARLVRAKRESAELDLQLQKNEVHRSEDVELALSDMLIRFRTRLLAIPAKQSPILSTKSDQAEVFKILKAAIDEALEELSDYNNVFGEEAENAAEHEESV